MTIPQPARAALANLLHPYTPNRREQALDAHAAEVLTAAAALLEGGNPDRNPEFSDGVDWAVDALRSAADKTALEGR